MDAGVVGAVVSRMIACGFSGQGIPVPLRSCPEMVLFPLPLLSVHATVVAVEL
jgi:hypothetical protein